MIFKPVLDRLFHLREKAGRAMPGARAGEDPCEKPFLDHLEDLRMMFIKMIIAQFVFTFACFAFNRQLFDATYYPLESPLILSDDGATLRSNVTLQTISPAEPFMLSIKVAFIAAFMLAFPFHAYFLAGFVFPGLTPAEKKYLKPGIAIGFLLFLAGSLFAFFLCLPYALKFLFAYGQNLGVDPNWRLGYYIAFVTQVTLLFGLTWELPLVVTLLVKLRLLTYRAMKNSRSIAIMVLCVIAAVATPPDPVTMIFMAVPLIVLYEVCIWIAYFLDRKREAIEAAEEAEYQQWLKKYKEEEARIAEERRQLATAPPDQAALTDQWDAHEDYDYDADHAASRGSDADPYQDWQGQADEDGWIDHYSEDLHEVECPEDRANIARRRKRKALIEAARAQAESLVNINRASLQELASLPGIDETIAQKILEGGPYGSVQDLLDIDGITRERLDAIESRIFAG